MKTAITLTDADAERFWAQVFIRTHKECWEYSGKIDKNGRARFNVNGRTIMAHRIAFLLEYEWMPSGEILRTCHNKTCVNPHHMSLGKNNNEVATNS